MQVEILLFYFRNKVFFFPLVPKGVPGTSLGNTALIVTFYNPQNNIFKNSVLQINTHTCNRIPCEEIKKKVICSVFHWNKKKKISLWTFPPTEFDIEAYVRNVEIWERGTRSKWLCPSFITREITIWKIYYWPLEPPIETNRCCLDQYISACHQSWKLISFGSRN